MTSAGTYDTMLIDPEPDRDHVLGIGAGIEVDAAQHEQQPVPDRVAPRPRLLRKQCGYHDLRKVGRSLEPFLRILVTRVQMGPQQTLPGLPCANFVLAQRSRTT